MNQILYNLRLTYKTIKSRNHNPPPRNEAISSRSLGSAPSIHEYLFFAVPLFVQDHNLLQ